MASCEVVLMVKHRLGLCAVKSAKDWSFDDFLQHVKSNISNSKLEFKYDIDGYIDCSLNSHHDWSSLMCLVNLLGIKIVNVACYEDSSVVCDDANVSVSNVVPHLFPTQNQELSVVPTTEFSREPKRQCGVDVDRISNLPDPILCKILSLLPTKNAVATSILSTKWKGVSPFLDAPITIDLDDSLLLRPTENKSTKPSRSFTVFVDTLLSKTLKGCTVEVMKLKCSKYYDSYKISSWVGAVVSLKIQELVLSVRPSGSASSLVNRLRFCTALTRLELGKDFQVEIPEGFSLPTLRVLLLFKLEFCVIDYIYNRTKRDIFCDFIDGCPALEDLCLSKCRFQSGEEVKIKSSVLKKLTIKDCLSCRSVCKLLIDVPDLEVLIYDDCFARKYSLSTFDSIHYAHIDVGRNEPDEPLEKDSDDGYWSADVFGVWQVVTACSGTINLFLATQAISSLQRSDEDLPMFDNLTSLALGCVWRDKGWALLAKLLGNAPNLAKLTLEGGFGEHKGGYSHFASVLYEKPPLCLEAHIKVIEFKIFGEEKDEISLVEYFLNNGKAVQTLRLSCLPFKKASTSTRLRLLPEHSKIDFQPR